MATKAKRSTKKAKPRLRSVENPNVPLNVADPDDTTWDALGGGERTSSGVRVTTKKALGYPAIWRAVNLISGDIAKLPLFTYKWIGENREIDRKHPAYRLLAFKPNPIHTAFVFKQVVMGHALTRGNGYAYIDRLGPRPKSLLILDPDKVEPVRVDGEVWYLYGQGESVENYRRLPSVDVLHFRGLGNDGLQGYPVLQILRDSVGAALAARDYSARHFRNSARPGGVIEYPTALKPVARTNMRESWERIHKGLDNSHKIAILEEGAKFVPLVSTAKDAQLLESREFDAREIANIFGVPTHKLGDSSKVAYNSLGQENQSYYDDTLSRWMKLVSEEMSDKLLSEKEKASESHLVDFDCQSILRYLSSQTQFVTSMTAGGLITVNEGRAILGLNPIKGGDKLREQKASGPVADQVGA